MAKSRKIAAAARAWFVATALVAGCAVGAHAQGFDVASVPKPDGAEIAVDREASRSSVTYVYASSVPNTIEATEKALGASGWMRYRTPDQDNSRSSLRFKNGRT